ncbi:MAG: ABC transporter substrate-binding protein [Verrucomicrobia bacterium]|nr:MAG: ABC transporter substrate-binding protein [Verrucomicrobiota bacterium]
MSKIILLALGALLLVLSVRAEAQQPKKVPSIGYLSTGSPSSSTQTIEAFRQGLHELGYAEGKNITIEYRFAEGREDRLRQFASELVRFKVDVIFVSATVATLATKNATTTIPIVFTIVDDPIAFGLIDSLGHPGGNITGLTSGAGPGLYGKRLELLKESFPRVSRVAALWNPDDPGSVVNVRGMETPARSLSLKLQSVEMRDPNDLQQAFSAMKRERAEALVTILGALVGSQRSRIVDLAAKSRLATMSAESRWTEAGGLMSYGPDYADLYRRAATYVDKILKGANPADLPVEQPTKFELVINLKTAKRIGLTIPPNVLARADKVIK